MAVRVLTCYVATGCGDGGCGRRAQGHVLKTSLPYRYFYTSRLARWLAPPRSAGRGCGPASRLYGWMRQRAAPLGSWPWTLSESLAGYTLEPVTGALRGEGKS